ncbi:tape measure protein [Candidatus Darwinibacter acetoxidans]
MAGTLGTLAVAITGSLSGLEKAFGDVEKKVNDINGKMQTAGQGLIDYGNGMTKLGKGMTKYVTAPILGAATAAGTLVASLGWGRLKAIDAAKAQLEGFGYSLQDVERISKQVNEAVTGTTMTMAEGTSVAAGALAAGVKEGEELVNYIKRVGNAAVGSGREVSELAMIFNRVQGGGRLMTRELNMIEQGMPGFSMAMAEHLGVSLEEFRKMVSGSKVSAEDFMVVMDSFAGDMADAYAGTWEGMVKNTKANIGIIGENLLGGVFEQSKESITEFLELLRSDEAREWARETGAKIAETFGKIVDWVKKAIEWWTNLDDSTKGLILKIIAIAVVAGPILIFVGKLITAIGTIIKAFKAVGTVVKVAGVVVKGLGAAFTFLTSPIGLIVLAIAAVIAIGVLLYKNWDTIKEKAIEIWTTVKDFFGEVIEGIVTFFSELPGKVWKWLTDTYSKAKTWSDDMKKKAIEAGTNFLNSIIDFVKQLPGKLWNWLLETIRKVITWTSDLRNKAIEAGSKLLNSFIDTIKGLPGKVWDILKETAKKLLGIGGELWDNAKRVASDLWEGFKSGLGISSPSYIERALMSIQDTSAATVDAMTKDFRGLSSLPMPEMAMNYSLQGAGNVPSIGSREVRHSGTIRVEGVNDRGQLSAVVDIVIEQLLQEVRA